MPFYQKLKAAAQRNHTLLCVGLDPTVAACPRLFMTDEKNPVPSLLRWNQAIIEATADLVCCYKPNIAFYEALGPDGMTLLRETMAAIPSDIPILLDAKRGDIGSTAAAYAHACFEELGADAVTLSPYLGKDSIAPFAAYKDKGLFVLCHTSNPSAGTFQEKPIQSLKAQEHMRPLFMEVAEEAVGWSPAVGLVMGATYPQALADVRTVAPDSWFLVPGIGTQQGDLEGTLAAGLRADGLGLLISATRSITQAQDPRQAAADLRALINQTRRQLRETKPKTPGNPLQELVIGLAHLEAIQFGDFTLASGKRSPLYIDLRLLVSQPRLLQIAATAYAQVLHGAAPWRADIHCDRIAGIPYAALPIGTAVSLASDIPLIYNRKERKTHGLGKDIEGHWQPGERVVIIEDVITSGGSIVRSVALLRAAGLVVEDAIVLLDRQQGGVENLQKIGIRVHSILDLAEMLDVLVMSGHLPAELREKIENG